MAYLLESDVRAKAARATIRKSAQVLLSESVGTRTSWDIFLSHSISDQAIVLGVLQCLTETGCAVYVDWIDDRQLNRNSITSVTADVLRTRMGACKSLLYLHSSASTASRWMPWELGYFDGLRERVAVLPVVKTQGAYVGNEYLGLYPTVEIEQPLTTPLRFVVKPDNKALMTWIGSRTAASLLRGR